MWMWCVLPTLFLLGCSSASHEIFDLSILDQSIVDASKVDQSTVDQSSTDLSTAGDLGLITRVDAAGTDCSANGAPGTCIDTTDCGALGDHTPEPGYCPGPSQIECCIRTPSVSDNPPIPTGYVPMQQAAVTSDMTTWAVAILHDPTDYPLFATATRTFGSQLVLARVEWHPPDFQNSVVHRGVTLYQPK